MQKYLSFPEPPVFLSYASVVGREERRGPLGASFDLHEERDLFGQKTWEKAEGEIGRCALNLALKKAHLSPDAVDLLLAGDLQNQCVASSYGLSSFSIPYLGLYGACSTCTEGLFSLASFLSGCPSYRVGAVVTTSHNCAAERQFRLPVEYGGQRPPTAQWTATAGGAFLLSRRKKDDGGVFVLGGMAGKIVDGQISDGANMGAAMAPAAADTLLSYFSQSGASPADFDAVVTGDLGTLGSRLLLSLLKEHSLDLSAVHVDCGTLLYDTSVQDAHCGASGCGCSAAVLASYFLPLLAAGKMKNILFLSTGALMSPTSLLQGENILGVAPLLRLSSYPPFS